MGYFKALLQVLYRLIQLKINRLLAKKVYGKVYYRGVFLINQELKQLLDSLYRANISTIKIPINFIIIIQKLYSYLVGPLINILIDILYDLYRGVDLNINIGPILYAKIQIIRYYIAVIEVYSSTVTARYTDRL